MLQGSLDIHLDEVSTEERDSILVNRKSLQGLHFEKVICSTLKRTMQTAKLHGFENCIQEKLIDELNFGIYEGLPKKRMKAEVASTWIENPDELILGETLSSFEGRLRNFISSYSHFESVLAFSHGAVMRALQAIYHLDDISKMEEYIVLNGELQVLDF